MVNEIDIKSIPILRNGPSIIYFHSKHCPHCIETRPLVDSFEPALESARQQGLVNPNIFLGAFNVDLDVKNEFTPDIDMVPRMMVHIPDKAAYDIPDFRKMSGQEFVSFVQHKVEVDLMRQFIGLHI